MRQIIYNGLFILCISLTTQPLLGQQGNQQNTIGVEEAVQFTLHQPLVGTTSMYRATDYIVASNTITANANVTYEASGRVVMTSGFRAEKGSYFKASPIEQSTRHSLENLTSHLVRSLEVYPNPSQGVFFINLPRNNQQKQISIYDALGQIVDAPVVNEDQTLSIDMSDQPKGVYLIKVVQHQQVFTKRLVLR
ncbi:MAG: T9SS type A sorting domain-containing protein [Thermonemataceae bacterium]